MPGAAPPPPAPFPHPAAARRGPPPAPPGAGEPEAEGGRPAQQVVGPRGPRARGRGPRARGRGLPAPGVGAGDRRVHLRRRAGARGRFLSGWSRWGREPQFFRAAEAATRAAPSGLRAGGWRGSEGPRAYWGASAPRLLRVSGSLRDVFPPAVFFRNQPEAARCLQLLTGTGKGIGLFFSCLGLACLGF